MRWRRRMRMPRNSAPTRHEMASITNTILPADSILLLFPRYHHGAVVRCAVEAEQGAGKQLALCWLAAARRAASYRSLSMRQGGSGRECGGFLKAVVVVVVANVLKLLCITTTSLCVHRAPPCYLLAARTVGASCFQ